MNNTKLKSLLLKGIIDSDFLFLNQKSGKQLSHTKFHSKHKQVDITSLNLFETLKSLKQLVRSLKFIADTDNKILHIWLQNKQYLYILDLLLNNQPRTGISPRRGTLVSDSTVLSLIRPPIAIVSLSLTVTVVTVLLVFVATPILATPDGRALFEKSSIV